MANALAYLDLGQENFIGIDSSEDPTAFVGLLEKKMSFSLGSTPATNGHNVQTVYNDRRKTLFGSVLHSPAAQWFDSFEAALPWNAIKTQLIAQFADGKMQYWFRIEAGNLKDSPTKIKTVTYREVKQLTRDGQRLPTLTQMRKNRVKSSELESVEITLYAT